MLISSSYRKLLERDHEASPNWGTTGARYADYLREAITRHNAKSVLDYGAGKGRLADALDLGFVRTYDPGVPERAQEPSPADYVISTDVLEHVEPNCIDAVLAHLRTLTQVAGFHAISTVKAHHLLPNGRNAHLLVRPANWWLDRLEGAGFQAVEVEHPANKPRYRDVCLTVEVT